jgi:hypothetical protein
MFYINFHIVYDRVDIEGSLGTYSSEGMEFTFDTTSLQVIPGSEGLRITDTDSLAIYLKAAVSSSNTETSYNILPQVIRII